MRCLYWSRPLLNPDEEFQLQSPYCPQCQIIGWQQPAMPSLKTILDKIQRFLKQTRPFDHLWELSTYICIEHMYICSPFLVHSFPTVRARRLVCKANPDQLPGFPHPVASSPDLSSKTKTQQFYKQFFSSQFQRAAHQHSVRFAFWICSKIPAVPLAALKHAGFFQHSLQSAPAFKTLSGDMLQIKRTSTSGQVSCGM